MITTVDLVLTGARAGKTVALNGKQFVKGALRLRGSHEQLEPVLSYYGRCYAAFPYGSKALKEAQERDAAEAAKRNGEHRPDAVAQPGPTNGVERSGGDDAPRNDQTSASADQHGGGHGDQAGSEGLRPDGRGHENSGLRAGQVSQQQQPHEAGDLSVIRQAVLALDPDVDENWTPDGKPAVDAVAQAADDASISRRQIDAAAADWNRDQAVAKKKLAKE